MQYLSKYTRLLGTVIYTQLDDHYLTLGFTTCGLDSFSLIC